MSTKGVAVLIGLAGPLGLAASAGAASRQPLCGGCSLVVAAIEPSPGGSGPSAQTRPLDSRHPALRGAALSYIPAATFDEDLASLMTSLAPGQRSRPSVVRTLAEVLGAAGWKTADLVEPSTAAAFSRASDWLDSSAAAGRFFLSVRGRDASAFLKRLEDPRWDRRLLVISLAASPPTPSSGTALLLDAPGLSFRRVSAQIRLPDMLPTVLEMLGVPLSPALSVQIAGVSLVPALRGVEGLPALARPKDPDGGRPFGPGAKALVRGRWKLVIEDGGTSLFDLAADPLQTRDLREVEPAKALELSVELLRLRARGVAAGEEHRPSAELRRKLRENGYW